MTVLSLFTSKFFSPTFSPERDLPSLDGKVAIVTGASAGLGTETALELARKGAHVFCVGRSAEKTKAVIDKIVAETGNKKVEFLQADLLDLDSVNKAADEFLARKLPLHILVNNAGIMFGAYKLSKQGIESQFATNHFAHVLLTQRLLPTIEKSQPSRIVNLSSLAHNDCYSDGIHYDRLNEEKFYVEQYRYGETKMANIHFTKSLQEKLIAKHGADCKVYVNAVHPGAVKTELQREIKSAIFLTLVNSICIDAKHGALTQIYVAGSEDVEKNGWRGEYFVPYCSKVTPNSVATNEAHRVKTWEWTIETMRKFYKKDFDFVV